MRIAVAVLALFIAACASRVEDHTIGKPRGTCPVHDVPLEKAKVPIQYGLIAPADNWREEDAARKAQFPHAAAWVSGGCCVSEGMPLHAWIWACPACTRAMERWKAENP